MYSPDCFRALPSRVLVTLGVTHTNIPLKQCVGEVEIITLFRDCAAVQWHTVDTPAGHQFQRLRDSGLFITYGFSPVGVGLVSRTRINDYRLLMFAVVDRSIWAT